MPGKYIGWVIVGAAVAGFLSGASPAQAQAFADAERAVRAGLSQRVFPGAVLVIGNRDTVLLDRGYGHLTWAAGSAVPTANATLWDLASLTKVIATTGVAARLVDRGLLDLDAPIGHYLPLFRVGDKAQVTVRMLLDHTSGFPAWIALWREAPSRNQAMARIAAEPLRRPPGTEAVYSDLNPIVLAAVLEDAGASSFADLVRREVVVPLGLRRTMFIVDVLQRGAVAPTSRDAGFVVRGQVNDLNAAFLGGIAGHAGLFGTGHDVARVARAWLGRGTLDGVEWLRPATVRRFLERSPNSGTRLLGWDTPDTTMAQPSSFGRWPGHSVYGHTGWTGTQVWIDPEHDRFVVLLTNRAYEPKGARTFDRMRAVRTAVADAVQMVDGRWARVDSSGGRRETRGERDHADD